MFFKKKQKKTHLPLDEIFVLSIFGAVDERNLKDNKT